MEKNSAAYCIMAFLLALALLVPIPQAAACQSYGEECSGSQTCCAGLECDISSTPSKCNQLPSMCTNMPPTAETSPPVLPPGQPTGSPQEAIEGLTSGQGTVIKSGSSLYEVGWFGSNWAVSGLVGVAIAISIIAIVAMFGTAFNLPEAKAFVRTELLQALVSVLLIISLIALVGFFDLIATQAIKYADLPVLCTGGEPCYISASKAYLDGLIDLSGTAAKESLKNAYEYQQAASKGAQTQLNFWWLLYAGSNTRLNAGMSMKAERAGSIFDTASKMLSSLTAQKYFIDVVSFGIAPIFMLLGILLRTFFFTRKLGGLLLSIAISLFFIYPLTYAFSWFTLNVTIYGDRTFVPSDPGCPMECTTRYPVAFFVKPSGEIEAFETTQQIMQAGISNDNWETGDVNNDGESEYPGLVACRNLEELANINAPNQCSGCPDYCREVPFPTNLPGCTMEQCKGCNPGCKIMRQRTDCELSCGGACPLECRTKVPVENKCYFIKEELSSAPLPAEDIHPADFTVDCSPCEPCPVWCRMLTKKDGVLGLTYDPAVETACSSPACTPTSMGGACNDKCFYVTEIGTDTMCKSLCSKDGYTCPEECRIVDFNSLSNLDTTNLASTCNAPGVSEACSACPDLCKVKVSTPAAEPCAPYPEISHVSQNCIDCPLYCRFNAYDFISAFSNARTAGGIPNSCLQGLNGLDCSSPSACDSSCKASPPPPFTCREYSANPGELPDMCRTCDPIYRVKLTHTLSGGSTEVAHPLFQEQDNSCSSHCGDDCRRNFIIPAFNADEGSCKDFGASDECGLCPTSCRVTGAALASPDCDQCSSCPESCKADISSGANFACSEYIGNGPAGQCGPSEIPSCLLFTDEQTCEASSGIGCAWEAFLPSDPSYYRCFGPEECGEQLTSSDCTAYSMACMWLPKNSPLVPLAYREEAYAEASNCKQCPENCRVGTYEGSCGLPDGSADCSMESCPLSCRAPILVEAPPSICQAPSSLGGTCNGCPAFCRRSDPPSGCPPECNPSSCAESCQLPSAPQVVCEGCFDCAFDCTYYPAPRTDCSEVCTDEALAGPINIGPGDYAKKLPGAQGEVDVKNVGMLALPALVLPLFSIVIVVSFIRVFSPILGGDIEIPGLSRLI